MPVFSEVIFTYCVSSSSPYHALLAPGSRFSGISLPFRHNRVCRLYVSWGRGCIPCLLSFFFFPVALLFYRHYNSLSVHSSIRWWRCRLDTYLPFCFDCPCYYPHMTSLVFVGPSVDNLWPYAHLGCRFNNLYLCYWSSMFHSKYCLNHAPWGAVGTVGCFVY